VPSSIVGDNAGILISIGTGEDLSCNYRGNEPLDRSYWRKTSA
jgi:hypothetical protein